MSDDWIKDAVERMLNNKPEPLISQDLADEILKANKNGDIGKELVVVQNVPQNGNTITEGFTNPSLGRQFQSVSLVKIGDVV